MEFKPEKHLRVTTAKPDRTGRIPPDYTADDVAKLDELERSEKEMWAKAKPHPDGLSVFEQLHGPISAPTRPDPSP